jgi:hypothetical protein
MKMNTNMVTMTYEDIRKMQEKYIKTTYREYRDVGTCCICGAKLPLAFSHDPKPVRPESWYGERENRCCGDCNADIVLPARMSIPFGDILTRNILTARYKNMNYKELRASFTPMRDDMFISNAQILKICGIK